MGSTLVCRRSALLRRTEPAWVIAQSPSFVLAAYAVTVGRCHARWVIVDAHRGRSPVHQRPLGCTAPCPAIMRLATAVIVTNDEFATVVRRSGGRPIVLPDPLPEAGSVEPLSLGVGLHLAVILTYAPDEPVEDVLAAACSAPPDVTFHLTGPSDRLDPAVRAASPRNVRFTGFLPEDEYWRLLCSVDAVVDLTKMPDCLVCGAYEAVAARAPSILSDSPAARRLFDGAAIFITPTKAALQDVLIDLDVRLQACRQNVGAVGERYAKSWQGWAASLRQFLDTCEAAL